jgi:NAD(P)-dependent dehydrogenase (short-subunit alcohol dehydrogenase family)
MGMGESLLDKFRLDGKVAVVTGSSKGIGYGIAQGLADAGASVVITARRADEVQAAADQITARGGTALAHAADVLTDTPALVEAAMAAFGRLDVWVSNAGGSDHKGTFPTMDMPEWHWDRQVELNLRTHFVAAQHCARVMEAGSSLIGISSTAALHASPQFAAYGAAKAGMVQLAQTLAMDFAPRRIRSNTVSPGIIPTESMYEIAKVTDEGVAAMAKGIPLGRVGTPDDIASAVLWLVSPAGEWVTGQNIVVCGGRG